MDIPILGGFWGPVPVGWERGCPHRNTFLLHMCCHTEFVRSMLTNINTPVVVTM